MLSSHEKLSHHKWCKFYAALPPSERVANILLSPLSDEFIGFLLHRGFAPQMSRTRRIERTQLSLECQFTECVDESA